MSNGWDNYKPAPIEVFHGEAMKEFHEGAKLKINEIIVDDMRYMNGVAVNDILANFKRKIMKKYNISGKAIVNGVNNVQNPTPDA